MIDSIVANIVDPAERAITERIIECSQAAEAALGTISLTHYEEPDYEAHRDLEMWEVLAPSVRAAIIALMGLKEALFALAPPPERRGDDIDITFDLIEPQPAPPVRDTMREEVDQLVKGAMSSRAGEAMREAVRPLTDLLVYELVRFGTRLRNPTVIADRWNLLADMQEMKDKFKKLIGALRVALLQPYTTPEQRERLVDYRTELDAAIEVRSALAVLARDVNRLVTAVESAGDEERPLIMEELFLRLLRFARAPAFQLMRAPDKRLMIEFRRSLAEKLGADGVMARARQELLDGFVRFLEAMSSINRREVLVSHDRTLARELLRELATASPSAPEDAVTVFESVKERATALLGRDPMLDEALFADPHFDEPSDIEVTLAWWRRALARI